MTLRCALKGFSRTHSGFLLVCLALLAVGCRSPLFRGQSPEDDSSIEVVEPSDGVELIRQIAAPEGQTYLQASGVGLVLNLAQTGSDPAPSAMKDTLIGEMRTHDVENPKRYVASDKTAMVHVRALIPPGARAGDRIDVEVRVPHGSKTTDLANGWLMMTRLREKAVLGNRVRTGRVLALAQGNVIIDTTFSGKTEKVFKVRGRILGGGQVKNDRQLGLRLREEYASPFKTTAVATAVNARFHYHDGTSKKGVAEAKDDVHVSLHVPLRYRNNVNRYLQVVRSIAVSEQQPQRIQRLRTLERMLHEPTTASVAALRLEAIGDEAVAVLMTGLRSPNPEVNFYAAEALGYLDVSEAADPLGLAARSERAFRWHALTALSTMDHVSAYDALVELLDSRSAEARYGAFRSLRVRNKRDPLYQGELIGTEDQQFLYHRISTTGEPMIHFSTTSNPEVVLFGMEQRMKPPAFLFAGKNIMLKGTADGRIRLIRFKVSQDEEEKIVSADLDQVIRGIASMGGTYSDVYRAIRSAKAGGYLESRLVVNARAAGNREFHRDAKVSDGKPKTAPIPDLFADRLSEQSDEDRDHSDIDPIEEKTEKKRGFLGRMRDK